MDLEGIDIRGKVKKPEVVDHAIPSSSSVQRERENSTDSSRGEVKLPAHRAGLPGRV